MALTGSSLLDSDRHGALTTPQLCEWEMHLRDTSSHSYKVNIVIGLDENFTNTKFAIKPIKIFHQAQNAPIRFQPGLGPGPH